MNSTHPAAQNTSNYTLTWESAGTIFGIVEPTFTNLGVGQYLLFNAFLNQKAGQSLLLPVVGFGWGIVGLALSLESGFAKAAGDTCKPADLGWSGGLVGGVGLGLTHLQYRSNPEEFGAPGVGLLNKVDLGLEGAAFRIGLGLAVSNPVWCW